MRDFAKVGRKIVAVGRNFANSGTRCRRPRSSFSNRRRRILRTAARWNCREGRMCTTRVRSRSPIPCHEVSEKKRLTFRNVHQAELGVVLGKRGTDIPEKQAMSYVAGYCLALDMTARDMQAEAIKAGLPWSMCKGFDTFTPVSAFVPRENVPDPCNVDLWLKVNGKFKQKGNTSDMYPRCSHDRDRPR
ncbi:MAG: hypothetical protein BJ554DRAFT_2539, partial [Olpidium bornovanus]